MTPAPTTTISARSPTRRDASRASAPTFPCARAWPCVLLPLREWSRRHSPAGDGAKRGADIVSAVGLPQLSDRTFITDGGMETTLIFHGGLDLPHFASFVLLDDEEGVRALREYFLPYVEIARDAGVGIVLDTPTWRANADW